MHEACQHRDLISRQDIPEITTLVITVLPLGGKGESSKPNEAQVCLNTSRNEEVRSFSLHHHQHLKI